MGTGTQCKEGCMYGPQGQSRWVQKISPTLEFNPYKSWLAAILTTAHELPHTAYQENFAECNVWENCKVFIVLMQV